MMWLQLAGSDASAVMPAIMKELYDYMPATIEESDVSAPSAVKSNLKKRLIPRPVFDPKTDRGIVSKRG